MRDRQAQETRRTLKRQGHPSMSWGPQSGGREMLAGCGASVSCAVGVSRCVGLSRELAGARGAGPGCGGPTGPL